MNGERWFEQKDEVRRKDKGDNKGVRFVVTVAVVVDTNSKNDRETATVFVLEVFFIDEKGKTQRKKMIEF